MTRKSVIWLVGLIVASLSWALFLVTRLGFNIEGENLLVEVLFFAAVPLMWPGIVVGIAFAIMKYRKRKEIAVNVLWIATGLFLLSAFFMPAVH